MGKVTIGILKREKIKDLWEGGISAAFRAVWLIVPWGPSLIFRPIMR